MKLELTKEGLDMLFRPYEQAILLHQWADGAEPTGSGALWKHANKVLQEKDPEDTISRASVIFAANRLVDEGIWGFHDATGKGGHHRKYYARMTPLDFVHFLEREIERKIDGLIDIAKEL